MTSRDALFAALAMHAVFAGGGFCAARVEATEGTLDSDTRTAISLCVGESGWRDLDTCAAEIYVIKRRAQRRGTTFERMAFAYSRALKRAPQLKPWLLRLRDRPAEPHGWPDGLSWARHRGQWLKPMLVTARHALIGDEPDPCGSRPLHFGSCRLDGVPTGFERDVCLPRSGQCFYAPTGEARYAPPTEPTRLYERVRIAEGES